ncbi:hypothetical protein FLA_6310 [Filimonas lacunae]|nr:hypothetical protein FLA_6310 [Filimonas lacunae]
MEKDHWAKDMQAAEYWGVCLPIHENHTYLIRNEYPVNAVEARISVSKTAVRCAWLL